MEASESEISKCQNHTLHYYGLTEQWGIGIGLASVCLGVLANVTVLTLFTRHLTLRERVMSRLQTVMAVADFIGCSKFVLFFSLQLSHSDMMAPDPLCQMMNFIFRLAFQMSNLCLLSCYCDKYLYILHPFLYPLFTEWNLDKFMMVCSFCLSVLQASMFTVNEVTINQNKWSSCLMIESIEYSTISTLLMIIPILAIIPIGCRILYAAQQRQTLLARINEQQTYVRQQQEQEQHQEDAMNTTHDEHSPLTRSSTNGYNANSSTIRGETLTRRIEAAKNNFRLQSLSAFKQEDVDKPVRRFSCQIDSNGTAVMTSLIYETNERPPPSFPNVPIIHINSHRIQNSEQYEAVRTKSIQYVETAMRRPSHGSGIVSLAGSGSHNDLEQKASITSSTTKPTSLRPVYHIRNRYKPKRLRRTFIYIASTIICSSITLLPFFICAWIYRYQKDSDNTMKREMKTIYPLVLTSLNPLLNPCINLLTQTLFKDAIQQELNKIQIACCLSKQAKEGVTKGHSTLSLSAASM